MPPVTRKELIARLRNLGFAGPYRGGDHDFMVRDDRRVRIPDPHGSAIGVPLLPKVLREAGVSDEEWQRSG